MVDENEVRRAALALPETTEKPSHGMPGFRVRDVIFARIHEQPDVLVLWRDSIEDREALIAQEPTKFFTTDHYARHPSVLVRLGEIDQDELRELLAEAWQVRAPTKLRVEHSRD